ncbi:MAG: hypothetical protein SGILL_007927, partial [Bacillariaceae sp.]
ENIGTYIGSRTKLEKGDAIVRITKIVQESNPSGGFVKKDERTGRWYKIKDSEARDKVGHAIRKAVQRLQDTQPKLAARLRKEYAPSPTHAAVNGKKKPEKEEKTKCGTLKSKQSFETAPAAADTVAPPTKTVAAHVAVEPTNEALLPQSSHPHFPVHPVAYSAWQGMGLLGSSASSSPALVAKRGTPINASTVLGNLPALNQPGQSNLFAQNLSRITNRSMFPGYDPLLALRQGQQRSNDELNLIRALQQQEE